MRRFIKGGAYYHLNVNDAAVIRENTVFKSVIMGKTKKKDFFSLINSVGLLVRGNRSVYNKGDIEEPMRNIAQTSE